MSYTAPQLLPQVGDGPTSHGRKSGDSARIPRPRNAFMIYRSSFAAKNRIPTSIEHDHRHICRIIGNCWNNLSEEEKQIWRDKANAEKAEHARRYPGYRFSPVQRVEKPTKRKVRRNGEREVDRCRVLAKLLLSGKEGEELENAVKEIDATGFSPPPVSHGWEPAKSEEAYIPPFMSPLLPPTSSQAPQTPQYSRFAIAADHANNRTSNHGIAPCADYHTPSPTSTVSDFQRAYQGYVAPVDSVTSPLEPSVGPPLSYCLPPEASTSTHTGHSDYQNHWDWTPNQLNYYTIPYVAWNTNSYN